MANKTQSQKFPPAKRIWIIAAGVTVLAVIPLNATRREPLGRTTNKPTSQQISAPAWEMREFFDAIRQVETGGQPNGGRDVVADGGRSIGPYCISRAYWLDSRVPGKWLDSRDQKYAERVMLAYWKRYVPQAVKNQNWEILAKSHNGGCHPKYHKARTRRATNRYWSKVKRIQSEYRNLEDKTLPRRGL